MLAVQRRFCEAIGENVLFEIGSQRLRCLGTSSQPQKVQSEIVQPSTRAGRVHQEPSRGLSRQPIRGALCHMRGPRIEMVTNAAQTWLASQSTRLGQIWRVRSLNVTKTSP